MDLLKTMVNPLCVNISNMFIKIFLNKNIFLQKCNDKSNTFILAWVFRDKGFPLLKVRQQREKGRPG